jgi:hypothetical protein
MGGVVTLATGHALVATEVHREHASREDIHAEVQRDRAIEVGESMLQKSFIISSTDLTKEEYGDTPLGALARIGIAKSEWDRVGSMKVARSVVMSPYLTTDYVDEDYVARLLKQLQQVITVRAAEILELAEAPAGVASLRREDPRHLAAHLGSPSCRGGKRTLP